MPVGTDNILVAQCRAAACARDVKPGHVATLAKSIEQVGLIHPIVVRQAVGGYEVIAGIHRLEAFRQLGRDLIPAIIRTDDDLHAELALIDENLIRSELSPAERAIAITRRKTIYLTLHPDTAQGVAGGKARQGAASDNLSFAESTAETTGKNRRTIERDAHRGETLGEDTLKAVTGTSLDKGEELDALAKLPEPQRERLVEAAKAGQEVSARNADAALPNGARAIMSSRQEPPDSLDYFPTPPWATRALIEHVFPQIGRRGDCRRLTAWEPASGEGHIAEVLPEFFGRVVASDIHDYGREDMILDFLSEDVNPWDADWIITNPPFGDKTEQFVLKALRLARTGVAMFVRLQWLETVGRYETVFRDHPPTVIAFFAERVNLCKGRWEPNGSTATAYIWLVWVRGAAPRAPFWIPPGQRDALTKSDDVERFTAHPVIKRPAPPLYDPEAGEFIEPATASADAAPEEPAAVSVSRPPQAAPDTELEDIPSFLRKGSAEDYRRGGQAQ